MPTISTMGDEDVKSQSDVFAQSCGTIKSHDCRQPHMWTTTALHCTILQGCTSSSCVTSSAPPLTLCVMYCAFDWLLRSPSRMAAV
jgi:hypothetical protein